MLPLTAACMLSWATIIMFGGSPTAAGIYREIIRIILELCTHDACCLQTRVANVQPIMLCSVQRDKESNNRFIHRAFTDFKTLHIIGF